MPGPDLIFSQIAPKYATFRPCPPPALVERVYRWWNQGGCSTDGSTLVDVGCGSGQSTHLYARHFDTLVGLDAAEGQLGEARAKYGHVPNIDFRIGTAEHLDFPPRSVDVVTVCAAVHWFDIPAFFKEVDRVMKPGGVLAVYSYLNCHPKSGDVELRPQMEKAWAGMEFWPAQHALYLGAQYKNLPELYQEQCHVGDDSLTSSYPGRLSAVMGYINSWSGTEKFRKHYGQEKLDLKLAKARESLLAGLGHPAEEDPELLLQWKYFLQMWRKPLA